MEVGDGDAVITTLYHISMVVIALLMMVFIINSTNKFIALKKYEIACQIKPEECWVEIDGEIEL